MKSEYMPVVNDFVEKGEEFIYEKTGVKVKIVVHPVSQNIDDQAKQMMQDCCIIWDTALALILTKNRKSEIVTMRIILCFLLKEKTDLSIPSLGKIFGHNDYSHTSNYIKLAQMYRRNNDKLFMKFYKPVKHLFDEQVDA